jgi:hypothetical protein
MLAMLAAASVSPLRAEPPASEPATASESTMEENGDQTFRLTVSPAAEPRPALRYRFLVPPVDQIHANAATFYYKAMVDDPDWLARWDADEQVQSWREMPLDKLPIAEIKRRIGPAESNEFNAALKGGARADYCAWEDPIRESGVVTLLPQAQKLRSLGRALAIFTRLQIAERRYQDAIGTLTLSYALSRHLGHAPSLVQNLVGMAIENLASEQARALIAGSDSPNLYWALTELAGQPVELRQALSYETRVWEFTIHKLTDLDQRTLSPREALDLFKELYAAELLMAVGPAPRHAEWGIETELAALSSALAIEPEARAYLLANGVTAADIDAMPILQRAMLYRWRQFAEVRDNLFKWFLLPDDENSERATRLKAIDALVGNVEAGAPFAEALAPIPNVYNARLHHLREINLLRAIEALRIHASQHGAWPQSLADVTIVPVPADPMTEKPFDYSLAAGVATLSAPRSSPGNHAYPAMRFELTLRKPAAGK